MGISDLFNISNLFEAFDASRDASAERTQPIRVCVGVDPETPAEVVEAVKGALVPETANAVVVVERLERGVRASADPGSDIALVLCGGSTVLCHDWGCAWLAVDVPTLMVGRSAVEVPACTFGGRVAQRVCATDMEDLLERVGHWIIDATDKDVAFAANFPFCRRAVATSLIHAVAFSNAAVCTFGFLPGIVDFTMVTANELKLVLDIASVYDQKMTLQRLPEVLSVFAFGFVIRTVASGLERFVPKLSWLIKGAAGYAGALITGYGLVAHFEGRGALGEGFDEVLDRARDVADGLAERVGTITGDVVKVGPDATYSHPKMTLQERLAALRARAGFEETEPEPDPGWVELGPQGVVIPGGSA